MWAYYKLKDLHMGPTIQKSGERKIRPASKNAVLRASGMVAGAACVENIDYRAERDQTAVPESKSNPLVVARRVTVAESG
jgi:hypothetical protein